MDNVVTHDMYIYTLDLYKNHTIVATCYNTMRQHNHVLFYVKCQLPSIGSDCTKAMFIKLTLQIMVIYIIFDINIDTTPPPSSIYVFPLELSRPHHIQRILLLGQA